MRFQDRGSLSDRTERGRAALKAFPHESWAELDLPSDRPDPLTSLLSADKGRLEDLIPIRHYRMLADAFTLYRGSASVMAEDLSQTPVTGIEAQLCGDAHVSNFGLYAAPDRSLVFDVNDFDETTVGPWEWDLRRLCASVVLSGRASGISAKKMTKAVKACSKAYRTTMVELSQMDNLKLWYSRSEASQIRNEVPKSGRKQFDKVTDKARKKTSQRAVQKLTETSGGRTQIISKPPSIVPVRKYVAKNRQGMTKDSVHQDLEKLNKMFNDYKDSASSETHELLDQYQPIDFALKVVGVGSVGMRNFMILMAGVREGDFLMLQLKQAVASALAPQLDEPPHDNEGQRVVQGQRLMQAASDPLLGWTSVQSRDFYMRQLWDMKGSIPLDKTTPDGLELYAELCAAILARSHARTADRIAVATYLKDGDGMDKALAKYSASYADVVDKDYAILEQARKDGKIQTEKG